VIESFRDKLEKTEPDWLTKEELNLLKEAVEVNRFGKSKIRSRNLLFHLNSAPAESNLCDKLVKLFQSYSDYSKINIIIYDLLNHELAEELIKLIRASKATEIVIDHVMSLHHTMETNTEAFVAIYKLINYKYYNAYYLDSDHLPEDMHSCFSNIMIVKKVTKEGIVTTDLIKSNKMNWQANSLVMNKNNNCTFLTDNPGETLYNFYFTDYIDLQPFYLPIRMPYSVNSMIDRLVDLCEYLLSVEKKSSVYLIKHNMCIQMIPTEILYNMLLDANFLGLSEKDAHIQRLVEIITERFYHYFHANKMKTHLFTKRGLTDFVKNHIISDHFYQFREFTIEEISLTLNFLIEQVKTNDYFKILLLKEDYKIGNIEYIYFENEAVYLFDSCSGYDDDVDEAIITAKPFLDIFDDFIKNELIPKHTYSEEETLAFLEQLYLSLSC
jgi:hypothetical protein